VIRHPANPIIARADIRSSHPELKDVSSVFNPGGCALRDGFMLLLRVQNRARRTWLVKAFTTDGIHFQVDDQPIHISGLERCPHAIYHIYDPRVTRIDGIYRIIVAMDTGAGCFIGLIETSEFESFAFRGIISAPDVRNGVLFPEKIAGRYHRFERPNRHTMPDGIKTGSTITCSVSDDLLAWTPQGTVLHGNPHFWDELIGSGPPPIKTRQGWLHIYHGVAMHFGSANIYQAGVSLHDIADPCQLVSRGSANILEPRELYEQVGQVPNVVFPTALWVKEYDTEGFALPESKVYLYYGAADTCVAMASTTIKELIGEAHA
jgi:beta-1,4-mannooligosaccharide/beta-1,4-mannosyl-N-acetylglucosamine phosphorylase